MGQIPEGEYEVVLERTTERVLIRSAKPRQLPAAYKPSTVFLPERGNASPRHSRPARVPRGSLTRKGLLTRNRSFARENPLVVVWIVALVVACGFEVKACCDQAAASISSR